MTDISLDIRKALPFLPEHVFDASEQTLSEIHGQVAGGTGRGNDFLGWVRLPSSTGEELLSRITDEAERIRRMADAVVVVGIGGSYLGARAVIDALSPSFPVPGGRSSGPRILYAGENLSEDYHASLLDYLDGVEYAVVVISKSGTTTEPAVAFRILKNHLERKYGRDGAARRIVALTDRSRGALKKIAAEEGYPCFVIPDDVGGRYSVLTPVGLIPIALAGFDIRALVAGAAKMEECCLGNRGFSGNPSMVYAAVRYLLYNYGKKIEIMSTFQPHLVYFTEWWKQLYGESEGKEGKGIFPAGVTFTTDLHSMGQYIQEGPRIFFETVLSVQEPRLSLEIPIDPEDADGLNFLAGKRMSEVNRMAELGTLLAHVDGGVPNIRIGIPRLNESTLGQLIYFYEFACALSGYALEVNPFDQPGVEAYKKNMFSLLGKPGYEKEGEELKKKAGI